MAAGGQAAVDASGARDSEAELSDDSSDTSEYSSDDNSDDDSDDSDDDAGERDGLDPTTAVPSDSQPDESGPDPSGGGAAAAAAPVRKGAALEPAQPPSHVLTVATGIGTMDTHAIDARYPQVFLNLKSMIMNSRSINPVDMFNASKMSGADKARERTDKLYAELSRHPGSTWAAYSARRLLKRRAEAFLPPRERTIMSFQEAEPDLWAAAVKKQKDYEIKLREEAAARIRAAKRGRGLSDSSGYGSPRRKRTWQERENHLRIYKCKHKHCSMFFTGDDGKGERQDHYETVHKFTLLPGDMLKKVHRCPAQSCRHRYARPKELAGHIELAHSTFAELLDVGVLVDNVSKKMRPNRRTWACPFSDCERSDKKKACKTAIELDDHIISDHAAPLDLMFLKLGERRKLEARVDREAKRIAREQDALKREHEAHARMLQKKREEEEAKIFRWKDDDLDKLTPRTLVWARYRQYPFWPGLVETNYKLADGRRGFTVFFFGDTTCEKIVNFDKNLRPLRCDEYDEFVKAGKAHSMAQLFGEAMGYATAEEDLHQPKSKSKKKGNPAAPAIDRGVLRNLARRGGQESTKDEGNVWNRRKLRQLKVGTQVWYKYKSYPFWPAVVADVKPATAGAPDKFPKLKVEFFGDHAKETVIKGAANLRMFRNRRYEAFSRAGKNHPHGGDFFWQAVQEAVEHERIELGLDTGNEAPPSPSPSPSPAPPAKKARLAKSSSLVKVETKPGIKPAAAPAATAPLTTEEVASARKLSREAKNLSFGAPGRKNANTDLQMSARERRMLEKQIQMIEFADPNAEQKTAGRGGGATAAASGLAQMQQSRKRKRFDWAKVHGGRRIAVSCDLFSAPRAAEVRDAEAESSTPPEKMAVDEPCVSPRKKQPRPQKRELSEPKLTFLSVKKLQLAFEV